MMNREVRTVMDTHPVTVSPDVTVEELSQMMLSRKVQQVPVVENGKFVGLITSYDLWLKIENNEASDDMTVRDVMTKNVIKISPKDKLGTAAELFADRKFKTLPVVNLRDELKGMITAFDIIKIVFNEEYDSKILYEEEFVTAGGGGGTKIRYSSQKMARSKARYTETKKATVKEELQKNEATVTDEEFIEGVLELNKESILASKNATYKAETILKNAEEEIKNLSSWIKNLTV